MPQLTQLVLVDRQATPVNHTFTPTNLEGGWARLTESTGVPLGDRVFSISSPKTSRNGRRSVDMTLAVPVVQDQTINGVVSPNVVRTSYATIKFNWDPASSEQERKDVVGMVASALGAAQPLVNDTLVKLQGIY